MRNSQGASSSDSEPTLSSERTLSLFVGSQQKSSVLPFEPQVEMLKLQHDLPSLS